MESIILAGVVALLFLSIGSISMISPSTLIRFIKWFVISNRDLNSDVNTPWRGSNENLYRAWGVTDEKFKAPPTKSELFLSRLLGLLLLLISIRIIVFIVSRGN